MIRPAQWILFCALALALYACVSTPPLPPLPLGAPAEFPSKYYQQAASHGRRVDRIDPHRSLITVYAYRGGPLASAGHDHVVASHDVHGYILVRKNPAESRADLYFPVATLQVDEADLRAKAGFNKKISAQDAQSTRQNMLRSVLVAPNFPYITMRIRGFQGNPPQVTLDAQLTLHGQTRDMAIPALLRLNDKSIGVEGEFRIKQTDFGMTPYGVLGGALVVKDPLLIHFQVYASS